MNVDDLKFQVFKNCGCEHVDSGCCTCGGTGLVPIEDDDIKTETEELLLRRIKDLEEEVVELEQEIIRLENR